jgi:exoribonuclease-2
MHRTRFPFPAFVSYTPPVPRSSSRHDRDDLKEIARRAMREKGLEPDFSRDALSELDRIRGAAESSGDGVRDLRSLLWCSIDNDDSRDLDQLTVAERVDAKRARIWVAVADVDALVRKDSAIDAHARKNTTSVYTAAEIFPMLPEKLSTDLTSLNEGVDRLAVVVEMVCTSDGEVENAGDLPRCRPQPREARLRLDVGRHRGRRDAGAREGGPRHPRAAPAPGRVRAGAARAPPRAGALELESIEPRPVFENDKIVDLREQPKNRARELIEDFMIAANGATARFLAAKGLASLRRVVRSPERWQKIVEVAAGFGLQAPAGAGRRGAREVPHAAAQGRPSCASRTFARHRQAHGRGRVRRRAAGSEGDRPLRPRGARLHALDGAEPPLPRT